MCACVCHVLHIRNITSQPKQAQNYKIAASPLMSLETQLMAIEVIYLWRALPFCGEEVRRQLLEVLQVPLPPEAQPFHHALCAWLTGGVLNSMQRFAEAERVRGVCVECRVMCECDVWNANVWV